VKQKRRIGKMFPIIFVSILSIFAAAYIVMWRVESHLYYSIVEGSLKSANKILEIMPWLSRSEQDGEPLTHSAIRSGDRDALVLLIEHGAVMDIFSAAFLGDLDSIESIVEEKPAVLEDRLFGALNSLNAAVMSGNVAAVELLIKFGANVDGIDANDWSPLRQAVHEGKDNIARILLANGATSDIFIHSGLGDIHEVSKYLNLDPTSLNSQDPYISYTPLHWAAHRGQTDVMLLLLEKGAWADFRIPYVVGTPMTVAQKAGHEDAITILHDAGAE